MKYLSKHIGLVTILLCGCWLIAENFVVKKKKNSVPVLKDECYDAFGQSFKLLPRTSKLIAEIQEIEIDKIYEYLEGNKHSFFASTNKEQLQKCLNKIQQFNEQMITMQNDLQDFLAFLQTLKEQTHKKGKEKVA